MEKASSLNGDGSAKRSALDRLKLRFHDRDLESAFRADYFRHNLGNFRFALLGGVILWVVWGLALHTNILALADKRFDLIMRRSEERRVGKECRL